MSIWFCGWQDVDMYVYDVVCDKWIEFNFGQVVSLLQLIMCLKEYGVILVDEVGMGKMCIVVVLVYCVVQVGGCVVIVVLLGLDDQW